jgi:transposase InsO family protein
VSAGYLHWFNCRRIHGAIGDVTPAEWEAAWYAANGGKNNKEKEAA